MSSIYYKIDGTPCSAEEWIANNKEDMRRVAETTLSWGGWISTVHLGIDHNFGGGKPLLFETIVFSNKDMERELWTARYSTVEEARKGHEKLVKEWSNKGKVLWTLAHR